MTGRNERDAAAASRRWPLGFYRPVQTLLRAARTGVDQDQVLEHLNADGGLTMRYGVMVILSCAIAILGLLLSSPAVIIGAMLISPLMTPIMLFGFSLATLDLAQMRRSLAAIAVGTLLAVAQSAAIVWLSPLQSTTPEILARTAPNFFDLLVAIFSAVAGAYAVAQRKGETIVGVAIATALMPPLAVVGYGIATRNWPIFSGAGGLFMTNLLAIGFTASIVAKVLGFGAHNTPQTTYWHALGIAAVFAFLSIPLGLSLQEISRQALLTAKARTTLQDYFRGANGHIYGMTVKFPGSSPVEVEALALVQTPRPGAEAALQKRLARRLGTPLTLRLSQMPIQQRDSLDRQAVDDLIRRATEAQAKTLADQPPPPSMAEIAARATGLARLDVSQDAASRRLLLRADLREPARLPPLRAAIEKLQAANPNWRIQLQPSALPALDFAEGETALEPASAGLLDDIVWGLKAAGIRSVRVTGHAHLAEKPGNPRIIACKRAQAVADALEAAGISAIAAGEYSAALQQDPERETGRAQFRRADIVPLPGDTPG